MNKALENVQKLTRLLGIAEQQKRVLEKYARLALLSGVIIGIALHMLMPAGFPWLIALVALVGILIVFAVPVGAERMRLKKSLDKAKNL